MQIIFKAKGLPKYAKISQTSCNKAIYNGLRVQITDEWESNWAIMYDNGKMAFDRQPPKYAIKLAQKAFNELHKYYPSN